MVLLVAACAVVEPPPGGPPDEIRPHLALMEPDSGSVGLRDIRSLDLTFSEKMDRVSAVSWLHFFPEQRIRQTKWHGATRAEVVLEQPLPPDTLIIVEIAAGMKDAHKVKSRRGRRYPIATGDSIPSGRISGVLIMADSAVTNGVVELFDLPPDSLEYFQQPLVRRTVSDRTGAYVFDWLPVPGGPWLLRAFADANGDLRPGEREAQRLLPDTLSLAVAADEGVAGVTTLFSADTPGRLRIAPFAPPPYPGATGIWSTPITEADTGWVPVATDRANFAFLDPAGDSFLPDVAPGLNRLVVFVDVDGDSLFSGVPDSLLPALPDSPRTAVGDTVAGHFLEPWQLIEGVEVEPGLESELTLPVQDFVLTPWVPPAMPDTLNAAIDSLGIPAPTAVDTLDGAPDKTD